jgi:hypothetical protein
VRRRWKILLYIGAGLLVAAATPVVYTEVACTSPLPGFAARAPYQSLLPDASGRRPEARTWLTYPEWYIVHSADSFGRFLARHPPSRFSYRRQVRGFWDGLCTVSRAAAGSSEAGGAKVMLYTIGISFSAEMAVKAIYENTFGRLSEWLSGWPSADDRYATYVQQSYGAFMHETPWYAFPFGQALSGLWSLREPDLTLRHWERRLGLSLEYGGKALYGGLIGWMSGATLGRDERTLRFVARADPATLRAIDPRVRVVARLGDGRVAVEAPRYARFTELMLRLADSPVRLVEIAGNDDIFVTVRLPDRDAELPQGSARLLEVPLEDRPGWRRLGVTVRVEYLLPWLRDVRRAGGEVEHVHDY